MKRKTLEGADTALPTPRLLNAQQIALWLGVHPRTVGRLAQNGQIPHVRVGNAIRFDATDVIEALKKKV